MPVARPTRLVYRPIPSPRCGFTTRLVYYIIILLYYSRALLLGCPIGALLMYFTTQLLRYSTALPLHDSASLLLHYCATRTPYHINTLLLLLPHCCTPVVRHRSTTWLLYYSNCNTLLSYLLRCRSTIRLVYYSSALRLYYNTTLRLLPAYYCATLWHYSAIPLDSCTMSLLCRSPI